jgi:hypothetical protein
MAMSEQPLNRIQSPGVVAQPASIGPRQAEREKDDARKERRRRPHRPGIEETLDEELALRDDSDEDKQTHIDYHA